MSSVIDGFIARGDRGSLRKAKNCLQWQYKKSNDGAVKLAAIARLGDVADGIAAFGDKQSLIEAVEITEWQMEQIRLHPQSAPELEALQARHDALTSSIDFKFPPLVALDKLDEFLDNNSITLVENKKSVGAVLKKDFKNDA